NLFVRQNVAPFGVLQYDGHSGNFINQFTSVRGSNFTFGPDNNMYRTEPFSSTQPYPLQIGKYDGATGVRLGTFVSSSVSGLDNSNNNIKFGPDNNLYVDNHNVVLRYDGTTGAPLGAFTPIGSSGLVSVNDML